jgi:predicted Zn-dependent protease
MKEVRIGIGILLGLTVTFCPLGLVGAGETIGGLSFTSPGIQGPGQNSQVRMRFAGILDVLKDVTKEGSKERKLFEGVEAILGSATEIDFKSERTIGESLALEGFSRYGLPVEDPALQKYVNLVGVAVARNSLRPGLPYAFVVVDSPLQNAFSCPGGIIFVSSGLLNTIQDEAQLACILSHEVAHVGHKHALQSIQRARFFQGLGKITSASMKGEKGKQFEDMVGNLQTILFDQGLDKNMEFEADLSAMETAYRTGYNPEGIIEVLEELKRIEAKSAKKGSWFSTHPPLSERIKKCREQLRRYPDWKSMAQLPERYQRYSKQVRK